MARRLLLAASVIILAVAALAGCSGGDDKTKAANVAGTWTGTLGMAYVGTTPTSTGKFTVQLGQEDDYASGIATWAPVGSNQGITGSVDEFGFTFLLHFTCPSKAGGVTLTGTVAGDVMTITGGTGIACLDSGPDLTVAGAVGGLTRTSNEEPL
jgi:hypothetical protein